MTRDDYIPDITNSYIINTYIQPAYDITQDFYIDEFQLSRDQNNNYLDECKKKADISNASFFLVSDYNHNKDDYLSSPYKCYIPKPTIPRVNDYNKFYHGLISPMEQYEDFSNNFNTHTESIIYNNDITNNDKMTKLLNKSFYFTHNFKNYYFAHTNKFILYKNEYIDNIFNNDVFRNYKNLTTLKPYTYYDNLRDTFMSDIAMFLSRYQRDLIDIFTPSQESNIMKCNFYDETTNNIKEGGVLKQIMRQAKEKDIAFHELNSQFFNLEKKINKLSDLAKKTYSYNINKKLIDKQNELNSLLGFDGANNGKLHDTKLLKKFKLSENIILILIIIFTIFFYIKKFK